MKKLTIELGSTAAEMTVSLGGVPFSGIIFAAVHAGAHPAQPGVTLVIYDIDPAVTQQLRELPWVDVVVLPSSKEELEKMDETLLRIRNNYAPPLLKKAACP